MSKLKALIFDVDGTLADTERDGHCVAFNMAFKEAGLDWHWTPELYGELLAVTGGKERIRFYLDKYNTTFERPFDLSTFIAGLHAAKTRFYTNLMSQGAVPLRPGVERLMAEARNEGYRLAIATTTTPENVTALITHTLGVEALDWFEVIGAGDIVPVKKPASDIYDYVLEEMNITADEAVAFEDSRNGVLSSLAANLTTVITINGYTSEDDFSGAAVVLDQMGEPGAPFKLLSGQAHGQSCLNMAMVEALHQADHGA